MQTVNTSAISTRTASPEQAVTDFVASLLGRNVASSTITAYQSSIRQFLTWLRQTDAEELVADVTDITQRQLRAYLTHLGTRGLSGVYRRRQMAALRALFAYLVEAGVLERSPTTNVPLPQKEQTSREALRPDE